MGLVRVCSEVMGVAEGVHSGRNSCSVTNDSYPHMRTHILIKETHITLTQDPQADGRSSPLTLWSGAGQAKLRPHLSHCTEGPVLFQ